MSIDNGKATKTLEDEWRYVRSNSDIDFLNNKKYQVQINQIRGVLNGSQLTYRYILFTSALSKRVNPSIHYRVLQAGSDLEGAYDARSVAHGVVVPFEKKNGERLGGSNEPYLNRPARYPEFDLSNRDRNREAQRRLYNLLESSQRAAESDPDYSITFFRQVLKEFYNLPETRIEIELPEVQITLDIAVDILREFLLESGGGERLPSVVAAIFSGLCEAMGEEVSIKVYPANWSDKFAKTAGDIEFYSNGKRIKAVETKDKPISESDVEHCKMKAKQSGLSEYLIVNGNGLIKEDVTKIRETLKSAKEDGINLYIIKALEHFIPFLIIMGENGRKTVLDKVIVYLNEMRALKENKTAWKSLVNKYFKK